MKRAKKQINKKRSFTFFEILLVVLIIGLLFVALWRFFVPNNKNRIYGEICLNTIYWEIRNYINKAVTGKSIASWWVWIYPEEYIIIFDQTWYTIDFQYTYYTGTIIATGTYKKIYLTWTQKTIKECENKWYYIAFTGNVTQIRITKNLKEKIRQPSFSFLWTTNWSTGWIFFSLVENKGLNRRHFYTIIVDPRIQNVFSRKCLWLPQDMTKPCATWMRSQ